MTIHDDVVAVLDALDDAETYPMAFPADASFPCRTYTQISGPTEQGAGGTIHGQKSWLQIDCWGETYAEVVSMAAAVKTAIVGMDGSSVVINERTVWNEMDSYDADSGLYRRMIETRLLHS